jgi:hypothetical protein
MNADFRGTAICLIDTQVAQVNACEPRSVPMRRTSISGPQEQARWTHRSTSQPRHGSGGVGSVRPAAFSASPGIIMVTRSIESKDVHRNPLQSGPAAAHSVHRDLAGSSESALMWSTTHLSGR